MKAVILAGGKGTRAKPFTDFFPKAMIPVGGKPLIDHVIRYLFSFRFIDEIIVVSDFKGVGGQIKHYFEDSKYSQKIRFVQDSGSGTAGDLLYISKHLKKNSDFVLWFVDNLCAIDLKKMYEFFKKKSSVACISTRKYRKEETGFAEVNDGIITKFIEKPTITMQNQECLGVYILNSKILDIIRKKSRTKKNLNLSYDVLEELASKGQVSGFDIGKKPWIDAESPVAIQRNEKIIKKILNQMKS